MSEVGQTERTSQILRVTLEVLEVVTSEPESQTYERFAEAIEETNVVPTS
ncbi:MAG: hypothetical protein WD317_05660 [Balneolaceae bacterium]